MKLVSLLLLAVAILSLKFSSFTNAEETSITASDPPSTTDGSFNQIYSCAKDKAEDYAYCSGFTTDAVKLSLNPIALSAAISGAPVTSSAVYENGGSTIVFFNVYGTLKYTAPSPFALSDVYTPGDPDIFDYSKLVVDEENQVVYVSGGSSSPGGGKIYKIRDLDSTPSITMASSIVELTGADDTSPIDLILANDDLYVAFNMNPGRIARVSNISSYSSTYTKTVELSEGQIGKYPCFTKSENFLFVLTHTYGIISKLSVGATDEDFALVSTSPAIDGATVVASYTWLIPSPWYFFVICSTAQKFYVYDVASNKYQATSFTAALNAHGGVMNSKTKKLAISSYSAGTLFHYDYTVAPPPSPTTSASPISSFLALVLPCIIALFLVILY